MRPYRAQFRALVSGQLCAVAQILILIPSLYTTMGVAYIFMPKEPQYYKSKSNIF